ncbi:L,D-transpeptidase family protein [Patescibacteria group bacterium]|nr:L,D-transpeptidase family protein [Patescibacteria group bacterium]
MNKQNKIFVYSSGKLLWLGKEYKCAIGRNGFSSSKTEGDGATPRNQFLLREVYYRQDRLDKPKTALPLKIISRDDGWCDDPKDLSYNKLIKLPYSASYEDLWREDNIYDLIITIGHNDNPPMPGKGSAIFMHIARIGYTPTEGCVALSLNDLLEIIKTVDENTLVCIY